VGGPGARWLRCQPENYAGQVIVQPPTWLVALRVACSGRMELRPEGTGTSSGRKRIHFQCILESTWVIEVTKEGPNRFDFHIP
jgi:hypothetical protein